jgi:hypothetical protein
VIEITAVRLEGGTTHEHITDVQWATASAAGQMGRQPLIDWLNAGGDAIAAHEDEHVPLLVVEPSDRAPYVRTHADGTWTNDLLGLPRF